MSPPPSIGWITNLSAPYRHPVWSAIAERTPLTVGLLAQTEPNRRWSAHLPGEIGTLPLHASCLRWREWQLYVLRHAALRGSDIDVLILPGWENPAAWQLLFEARRRSIATVGFYESSHASHAFRGGPVARARRRFFGSVDAVVTVGRASERSMTNFGVAADRIIRTDNAVDVTTISRAAMAAAAPDEQRRQHFVYVGQLIERKNVGALLRAFAKLGPDARLSIAGEGPEAAALAESCATLGISGRVRFVGYLAAEDIPGFLATAQTLVLASTVEVYGLVVKEALAAGLHAVVSRPCGVAEDVAEMRGAFVCDTHSDSLAAAMQRSSAEWTGVIAAPEVLAHSPLAMAADVIRACAMAVTIAGDGRAGRRRADGRRRR